MIDTDRTGRNKNMNICYLFNVFEPDPFRYMDYSRSKQLNWLHFYGI